MDKVKVKRLELLEKLANNRKDHRDIFLKAQEGYRAAVIEELDRMLADARDGKEIKRHISLPEPEDHTSDYDCAIAMLAMSVDEIIEISVHEFDMYVMDNWNWKGASVASNMRYVK